MIRSIPAVNRCYSDPGNLGEDLAPGLACSMDELNLGMAAVQSTGRLYWANASFRAKLHPDGGLCLEGGLLRPVEDVNRTRFLRFLAGHPESERVLRISSVSRQLFLTRLCITDTRHQGPLTYIAVSEPGWAVSENFLRALFGLTPAECRIAQAVLAGASPLEFARAHAISLHTARTHIKAIMAKIGVTNRGALLCALAPLSVLASAPCPATGHTIMSTAARLPEF